MESYSKRFGNREGPGLLSDLDHLKQTVRQLQHERQEDNKVITQIKKDTESIQYSMMVIRASELLRMSSKFGFQERNERNQIVHGGDVLQDLKALEYFKAHNPSKISRMMKGFTTSYGLSPIVLADAIRNAPEEVIFSLNLRRDLQHLDFWINKGESFLPVKMEMIQKCDTIIDSWKGMVQTGAAYPENVMQQMYEELCNLHEREI